MTRSTRWTMILMLALCLAPAVAYAQGAVPEAPMSEADFINLAGVEKAGEGGTPEPGRPHEPAKGTEDPKAKKDEDSDDSDSSDDADDSGTGGDDEDDTDDVGDGDTADSGDDPAKVKARQDDATDDDDADDAPVSDAKQKQLDAEFQAALDAEGVSTSLDDIPEAVRPIVEKKIRDLEKGFTKAMQQTRADQKAAVTFKAEERFRKEKPAHFIVSMLLADPKLSEQVNQQIGELEGNATAVEGHKALVQQARSEAVKTEEGEVEKVSKAAADREAMIDRTITTGRAAARAAGVPFDLVEDALAAHVAIHGEPSEADIRAIAGKRASIYQRQLRQDRRTKSGQYVKDKVSDKRKAPPKVAGKGNAPAPGSRKMAKSDEEFVNEFVGRS